MFDWLCDIPKDLKELLRLGRALNAKFDFIIAAWTAWSKEMTKEVDDLLLALGEEDTEENGAAVLFDEMLGLQAQVLATLESFKAEIAAAGVNKVKLESAIANVTGDIAKHKTMKAAFAAARDALATAVATVDGQPAPGPIDPPDPAPDGTGSQPPIS